MKSSVILVVDDDPGALTFLSEALEERAATALVARSGESALAILERLTPDLILLDAVMPGLDGFETCQRIKQNDRLADVPVIFMTGLSDTDHVVQGFAVGGADYVAKPIVIEQLLARLHAHIANSRMAQRARSALDASGRHMFAMDAQGKLLWSTPRARALLGVAQGDDGPRDPAIMSHIKSLMSAQGRGPSREAEISLGGSRLRLAYLGSAGGAELLFRLTETDEAGAESALSLALPITPRESEVLLWLSRGKSNADIAAILDVSPRTINKHLEQIYKKIGVENRTAAVRVVMRIIEKT